MDSVTVLFGIIYLPWETLDMRQKHKIEKVRIGRSTWMALKELASRDA